ncbi:MAG: 2-oxoacid:acceptor oxidoreductase subunit alpha, partial [Pseudomonadota bacterium]
IWPFSQKALRKIIRKKGVKAVVVAEINLGQIVLEVERVVCGEAKVYGVPLAGGAVHEPDSIIAVIETANRELAKL